MKKEDDAGTPPAMGLLTRWDSDAKRAVDVEIGLRAKVGAALTAVLSAALLRSSLRWLRGRLPR